ncbi:hypothetical protein SteCoe_3914 [Stentor coeruleus]|uniref:Transmembrane protein 135 N-terminal domain-containing protein n=1 Tax=Stentor coeruleus TaxID=5963 RepID=A0A1R2CW52_9CILI|nr:hypothetical protein SteCoe_3914 [Stentor coeruleus]
MDNQVLCRHKGNCLQNALKGFVRGTIIGLGIRAAITLVLGLLKRTIIKNPLSFLKMFSKDNLRIVWFLSVMVGVYRSVLCYMRRKTKDEKLSSFVAGFASSIGLIFEESESRTLYALYLLVRSLDALCKYLVANKKISSIPNAIEGLYTLSMLILVHSRVFDPDALNHGFYNVINRFMKEPNDVVFLDMIGHSDHIFIKKK